MHFKIINVSHKMPSWVYAGCDEYLKRINVNKYSCNVIELKPKDAHQNKADAICAQAKQIIPHLHSGDFVIVLDERGVGYSSVDFAHKLSALSVNCRLVFIIGGAYGVDESIKQRANLLLSISSFTLPHGLVRIVLLEQIYRAISILNNHPYHKE